MRLHVVNQRCMLYTCKCNLVVVILIVLQNNSDTQNTIPLSVSVNFKPIGCFTAVVVHSVQAGGQSSHIFQRQSISRDGTCLPEKRPLF